MDGARDLLADHGKLVVASIAALGSLYAIKSYFNGAAAPRLFFNEKSESSEFVNKMPSIRLPYWPTAWCHEGNMMTIATAKFRSVPNLASRRELIDCVDGGEIALDWFSVDTDTDSTPTLVFLPGINGDSTKNYIRWMIKLAREKGWRSVVMNWRGTNGSKMKNHIAWSGGWTEDFRHAVDHIREKMAKGSLLVGVSYSLGSNVMVKYTCEEGAHCKLDGVVSISNPYKMRAVAEEMSTMYHRVFTSNAINFFKQYHHLYESRPSGVDMAKAYQAKKVQEYDEHFTSRIFGFPDAFSYYDDSACVQYLDNLRRPVLFISAEDDPVIPKSSYPTEQCQSNKHTILVLSPKGGHIGFLEGMFPMSGPTWADRLALEFLDALQSLKASQQDIYLKL